MFRVYTCIQYIRSGVVGADTQTESLLVELAVPATGKLLTCDNGCRIGCVSVILKCGAVVRALYMVK